MLAISRTVYRSKNPIQKSQKLGTKASSETLNSAGYIRPHHNARSA